ncbi:preprotein translocase [Salinisphaera japonica YTM-1]|uniref:Preprotein translocase n=1 Tax=Salinisphaera japonica YTM-1 TaxID=1209778 RepID=A0A423Q1H1_9GAMM|nr:preprotein translocase [Salinisphaera japonica YTM-1]
MDTFRCPDGKSGAYLWDARTPGLGIRARSNGSRHYLFQTRMQRETVRVTIGRVESWSLDDAQAEARRLRVLVDSGVHPKEEQQAHLEQRESQRQEAARATVTLADVWPVYIAARQANWSESHRLDHDKMMQAPGQPRRRSHKTTTAGPLYELSAARLVDLDASRITAWIEQEKAHRPTVAARAYRLLRACLVWCDEQPAFRGLVDVPRVFSSTVRRAVPKPRAKSDVLQREQLAPWFAAVRTIDNPVMAAYLQALLLTGARPSEMARLKWPDLDLRWNSVTLRDKVEGDRDIPLTPYLSQLFGWLPRRNEWVFSSPTAESGRLTDANHRHTRTLQAAGLPHVTLHGLRRSFGTLSEWVECPVGVVAQIQGHKPSALAEKHYRQRPLDLLRMWHVRIEAWVLDQAGLGQPKSLNAKRLEAAQ